MNNQTIQVTLKAPHDFYYGYKPLKAGDTLTIATYSHGDIRVLKSSRETYPGFGIRISEYELKQLVRG